METLTLFKPSVCNSSAFVLVTSGDFSIAEVSQNSPLESSKITERNDRDLETF